MSRRGVDPFDRRAMVLSIALHVGILVVAFAGTFYEPPEMTFVTYEIELVSPAPPAVAEEETPAAEEIVVERPEPEPAPPEPEPEEVVPVESEDPEPEPETDDPVEEPPPEVAEEETEATTVVETPPEEEPEVTGEALNVRIEGLRRDYPAYYENIIRQIQRCFRWREGGNWETTVFFYIDREGLAREVQFVARSGSAAFDFESMGAVECAGQGRFGPLPEDVPYDRFPVRFRFRPAGAPDALFPRAGTPAEKAQYDGADVTHTTDEGEEWR